MDSIDKLPKMKSVSNSEHNELRLFFGGTTPLPSKIVVRYPFKFCPIKTFHNQLLIDLKLDGSTSDTPKHSIKLVM